MTGKQLAHYLVGEKLGEGGMGVVYRGTDTRLKRQVALKFLTRALPFDAQERKRFLREARAASAINHPNVCVIHAIEEVEGEEFIVMEFVEGVTLRKWAHRSRAEQSSKLVPVRPGLAIVRQVAEGLDAAHKHGIVHRDVKPENVMITAEGRVKIMDFGLAKLAGESKLTRTGATVGTVAYMSPEQVQGAAIDAQTDIYSLGVLIYELLSGRTPFQADHVMGMMYAIVNTEPDPLQKARHGIDPRVAAIVMKCMEKAKKDRYATMGDVIRDITAIEDEQRTVVAGTLQGGGRRKKLRELITSPKYAIGLAVVLMAIAAILTYNIVSPPHRGGQEQGGQKSTAREEKLAETFVPPGNTHTDRDTAGTRRDTVEASDRRAVKESAESKKTKAAGSFAATEKAKPPAETPLPAPSLDLETNRGSVHPSFREGDILRIYVRVDRPCTVRVFYHTADGSHYVLTGPHDLAVRRSQVNQLIPIDTSECTPPFGEERLQAFATSGIFGAIRTDSSSAGYYTVTGDIGLALAASRTDPAAPRRGGVAERNVRVTTASR